MISRHINKLVVLIITTSFDKQWEKIVPVFCNKKKDRLFK